MPKWYFWKHIILQIISGLELSSTEPQLLGCAFRRVSKPHGACIMLWSPFKIAQR